MGITFDTTLVCSFQNVEYRCIKFLRKSYKIAVKPYWLPDTNIEGAKRW